MKSSSKGGRRVLRCDGFFLSQCDAEPSAKHLAGGNVDGLGLQAVFHAMFSMVALLPKVFLLFLTDCFEDSLWLLFGTLEKLSIEEQKHERFAHSQGSAFSDQIIPHHSSH